MKICEGIREIVVTKPEKKEKAAAADDDDEEDDSEDEEEETRDVVWKVERVVAEAAVKGVKKGQKIEVGVTVGSDMAMTVTARIVGTAVAIRGDVPPPVIKK